MMVCLRLFADSRQACSEVHVSVVIELIETDYASLTLSFLLRCFDPDEEGVLNMLGESSARALLVRR